VVPADHLAANEPARDVGVDRLRRVERRLAAPQRARAGLLIARGEEADQPQLLAQPPDDLLERRRALSKLRSIIAELRQLGLQLEVDASRAVLHGPQPLP